MKTKLLKTLIIMSLSFTGLLAQIEKVNMNDLYFGLSAPIDQAEIFAENIICLQDRWEVSISFSSNHNEVFYTVKYPDNDMQVYSRKYSADKWKEEIELKFLVDDKNSYAMEPFPSPNGNKLFYTVCDSVGCDIWFVEKKADNWINPQKLSSALNNDVVFYSTFINNNDMLYTNVSERKTFRAIYNSGQYDDFGEVEFGGAHA